MAPALSNIQGTKLTVTLTSSATENSRCVGITDGGSIPSSTQILSGSDSAGSDVAKTGTVACTGGGSTTCTLEMSGLTASTAHDVYCTSNGGVVSSRLDVSTLGDTDCDSLGSCSGHGTCTDNVCICQDGYGSATDIMIFKSPMCDQRACPAGKSWADVPTKTNAGHAFAECSDAGVCNRDNGQCECFDGFDGFSCDRTKCESECSGHGRCVSMREAANMANAVPLVCYVSNYGGSEATITWDADMIHGCVCDSSWTVGYGSGERQLGEWYGSSCQYKRCPSGNDPITLGDDRNCAGLWDNGKTFGKTVDITSIVVASNGATATVTFTVLSPATIPFTAGDVVTIASLTTTTSLNNAWTVTGTPTTTQFTFAATERSFTTDNTYTEAGTASTCKGVTGNLCHVECSNRGLCDSSTGICGCFDGYTGEACEVTVEVLTA